MISALNNTNINIKGVRVKPSGGIYRRNFYEGYFMETSPLSKNYKAPDKTNPIVKFFKSMIETAKDIYNASKPENL